MSPLVEFMSAEEYEEAVVDWIEELHGELGPTHTVPGVVLRQIAIERLGPLPAIRLVN